MLPVSNDELVEVELSNDPVDVSGNIKVFNFGGIDGNANTCTKVKVICISRNKLSSNVMESWSGLYLSSSGSLSDTCEKREQ